MPRSRCRSDRGETVPRQGRDLIALRRELALKACDLTIARALLEETPRARDEDEKAADNAEDYWSVLAQPPNPPWSPLELRDEEAGGEIEVGRAPGHRAGVDRGDPHSSGAL